MIPNLKIKSIWKAPDRRTYQNIAKNYFLKTLDFLENATFGILEASWRVRPLMCLAHPEPGAETAINNLNLNKIRKCQTISKLRQKWF